MSILASNRSSLFNTNRYVPIVIEYPICIGNPQRGHIFIPPPTKNLHIYEQIPTFVERLQGTFVFVRTSALNECSSGKGTSK